MQDIFDGFLKALTLILGVDASLREIVLISLQISGVALLLSAVLGIPAGSWLALHRFPGRKFAIALVYTGMGFPPVVIGLFVYMLLSRSGPLGSLHWLFTPTAMIAGQVVIALPVVAGLTMAAVLGVNPRLQQQALSLGATPWQATLALLWEARLGVVVALIGGFGGIISEVGAAMMLGGNIEGSTRVLTTAIVLETGKGEFAFAIALGLILIALTFLINAAMLRLQGRTLD